MTAWKRTRSIRFPTAPPMIRPRASGGGDARGGDGATRRERRAKTARASERHEKRPGRAGRREDAEGGPGVPEWVRSKNPADHRDRVVERDPRDDERLRGLVERRRRPGRGRDRGGAASPRDSNRRRPRRQRAQIPSSPGSTSLRTCQQRGHFVPSAGRTPNAIGAGESRTTDELREGPRRGFLLKGEREGERFVEIRRRARRRPSACAAVPTLPRAAGARGLHERRPQREEPCPTPLFHSKKSRGSSQASSSSAGTARDGSPAFPGSASQISSAVNGQIGERSERDRLGELPGRRLGGAAHGIVRGEDVEGVLPDVAPERREVRRRELQEAPRDGVELEASYASRASADEARGRGRGPSGRAARAAASGTASLAGSKSKRFDEEEARRVPDLPVGLRGPREDLLRERIVVRVVERGDPEPEDVGAVVEDDPAARPCCRATSTSSGRRRRRRTRASGPCRTAPGPSRATDVRSEDWNHPRCWSWPSR